MNRPYTEVQFYLTSIITLTLGPLYYDNAYIVVFDACNPSPCKNNQPCTRLGGLQYRCDCSFQYNGTHCEHGKERSFFTFCKAMLLTKDKCKKVLFIHTLTAHTLKI